MNQRFVSTSSSVVRRSRSPSKNIVSSLFGLTLLLSVLLVSSWFRKYPEQKAGLLMPHQAKEAAAR